MFASEKERHNIERGQKVVVVDEYLYGYGSMWKENLCNALKKMERLDMLILEE